MTQAEQKNGKYINVITENHKNAKKLFEIIIREILSIIIANTRDKRKRAKFTRIFLYIISNKYKQKNKNGNKEKLNTARIIIIKKNK